MQIFSIFKLIGIAGMSLIMAFQSAFAPPAEKPDAGTGPSQSQTEQEKQLTLDEAIDIAIADAGVTRENAGFTEAKLDNDDLIAHYDIEFIANGIEYDYEIAVSDGKILKKEVETADPNAQLPSAEGYISVDEAKAAALKKAKLSESDVVFTKIKLDVDGRTAHYDIEFTANGYEYEVEVNAKNGRIIDFDKERDNSTASKPVDTSEFITVDEAKAKALERAKLTQADVTFIKAELDTDDRTAHYDIKFTANGYEYEVEVNAKTGRIMDFDKEREAQKPSVDTSKYVTADEAKKAALEHAGFTADEVTELKAELDIDAFAAHYEVDFKCGGYEYEYKVDAESGAVISFEKERD